MPEESITEAAFRRYEREHLDVHHRTLALWSRPRDVAVFAFLAAFDSIIAPITHGLHRGFPDPNTQYAQSLRDGLIHGLRFLGPDVQGVAVTPQIDSQI